MPSLYAVGRWYFIPVVRCWRRLPSIVVDGRRESACETVSLFKRVRVVQGHRGARLCTGQTALSIRLCCMLHVIVTVSQWLNYSTVGVLHFFPVFHFPPFPFSSFPSCPFTFPPLSSLPLEVGPLKSSWGVWESARGTAAAAPLLFWLGDPALCGSQPLLARAPSRHLKPP